MKSILVAVSGTHSDSSTLDAAHAMAAPLKAHLDFFHIPLASIDMVAIDHHIDFACGSGLESALKNRLPKSHEAEAGARAHVEDFCAARRIPRMSQPGLSDQVTASWATCAANPDICGFMRAARTHDLTIIGRSAGKRSWSRNLLENLVTDSGRPVLIVPPGEANFQLSKAVVWWKDHHAAARAVTAALPFLNAAAMVTVVSVREDDDNTEESLEDLAKQLGWHGIEATVAALNRSHRPTINTLWSAALAEAADIIVMGGFSRSRFQEMIFGGCTSSVLEDGARPIFLLH